MRSGPHGHGATVAADTLRAVLDDQDRQALEVRDHGPLTWVRHAFHHEFMSYASRPCGDYDGDHLLMSADANDLHLLWGEAHRRTRWTR